MQFTVNRGWAGGKQATPPNVVIKKLAALGNGLTTNTTIGTKPLGKKAPARPVAPASQVDEVQLIPYASPYPDEQPAALAANAARQRAKQWTPPAVDMTGYIPYVEPEV